MDVGVDVCAVDEKVVEVMTVISSLQVETREGECNTYAEVKCIINIKRIFTHL